MKKNLFPVAVAFAAFGIVACNNSSEQTTTTDSTTAGTTSTDASTTISSTDSPTFDTSASYVDLRTGKTLRLTRDATTGRVRNVEDNSEVLWYFNPVTHDTFDVEGNVVNNYLIHEGGNYRLDEQRWKVKTQSDGDLKAKDGDEGKIKVEADEPEGKVKTEDGKVKIKDDGRVKVKEKNE